MSPNPAPFEIAWALDERLPSDSLRALLRALGTFRSLGNIHQLESRLSQENILELLEKTKFHLVVLPWYRYLAWKKIEAFYGLTRVQGPTVCGYFVDAIASKDLGDLPDYQRLLMIDLSKNQPLEALRILKALVDDKNRSGLRPLLNASTPVYFAEWSSMAQTSLIAEGLFMTPEFSKSLNDRRFAIQSSILALGHFLFSHTLGTSGFPEVEAAVEQDFCVLRARVGLAEPPTRDLLNLFWPRHQSHQNAQSAMFKYSDGFRAHWSIHPNVLEITLWFNGAKPNDRPDHELRNLWLEPLAPKLMDSASQPRVALPQALLHSKQNSSVEPSVSVKVKELQKQLLEKESQIRELKAGGVGVAFKKEP